jgi:hypothetical protein
MHLLKSVPPPPPFFFLASVARSVGAYSTIWKSLSQVPLSARSRRSTIEEKYTKAATEAARLNNHRDQAMGDDIA